MNENMNSNALCDEMMNTRKDAILCVKLGLY